MHMEVDKKIVHCGGVLPARRSWDIGCGRPCRTHRRRSHSNESRRRPSRGLCDFATRLFTAALAGRALVNVQNPLQLTNYTEPEPDIVLLKVRSDDYRSKKVKSEDALLVLEISDTTLRYDSIVKALRYAAAGIPELWIENLADNELIVLRNPSGSQYIERQTLHCGDTVSPLIFPGVYFQVSELLG